MDVPRIQDTERFRKQLNAALGSWIVPSGLVGDGLADDGPAINAALATGASVRLPPVPILTGQQLVMPRQSRLIGCGPTSYNGIRGATSIVRGFGGANATLLQLGDDTSIEAIDFDNNNLGTGECVQTTGSRARLTWVSLRKSGSDGWRIGKTDTGPATINANLWRGDQIVVLNNARYGVNVDDTNTTTSATFPLGAPNCNAGELTSLAASGNGSHGLRLGNAIDNTLENIVCQSNTGYGAYFDAYAAGNVILKFYSELNTAGDGFFHATLATQNLVVFSGRAVAVPVWTNANVTSNRLTFYSAAIGRNAGTPTATRGGGWSDGPEILASDLRAGGVADFGGWVETSAVEAFRIRGKLEGTTGGQLGIWTKRDGNTPLERLTVHNTGLIDLTAYPASTTYANDAAAAAGGVPIGQIYRNGSALQVRVT